MTTKVKVASFMEAYTCFLSYIDGATFGHHRLSDFKELKDKKVISFENPEIFWHGNHSRSQVTVELFLVESPVLFYVVKVHYQENSQNSHYDCQTFVFIPNA